MRLCRISSPPSAEGNMPSIGHRSHLLVRLPPRKNVGAERPPSWASAITVTHHHTSGTIQKTERVTEMKMRANWVSKRVSVPMFIFRKNICKRKHPLPCLASTSKIHPLDVNWAEWRLPLVKNFLHKSTLRGQNHSSFVCALGFLYVHHF